MASLDEKIINYIENNGPSTPIEISSSVGANSIIVTAVMIDACSNQRLKKSKRRIGSTRLYYLPGQEDKLRKKISSNLKREDQKLLDELSDEKVVGEFEVESGEKSMYSNLEDLVKSVMINYDDKSLKCWASPEIDEEEAKNIAKEKFENYISSSEKASEDVEKEEKKAKKELEEEKKKEKKSTKEEKESPKKEKSEEEKEEGEEETEKEEKEEKKDKEEKKKKKKKESKEEKETKQETLGELKDEFREKVLRWFEKQEITVESEETVKEGKEYELEAKVPTPLGRQTYLVKVMDVGKRTLGKSVLEPIAMDAIAKRIPVIVISKSGFAKNAKKYRRKRVENFVKLVSAEDLE